jgi:hypothetical protein
VNEARKKVPFDPVQRPAHYNKHPSGVEVADVTDGLNFNLGNAFKYLGREALKGNPVQDVDKALWYLKRELERREKDVIDERGQYEEHVEAWLEGEPDRELAEIYELILSAAEGEGSTVEVKAAVAQVEERLAKMKKG